MALTTTWRIVADRALGTFFEVTPLVLRDLLGKDHPPSSILVLFYPGKRAAFQAGRLCDCDSTRVFPETASHGSHPPWAANSIGTRRGTGARYLEQSEAPRP